MLLEDEKDKEESEKSELQYIFIRLKI